MKIAACLWVVVGLAACGGGNTDHLDASVGSDAAHADALVGSDAAHGDGALGDAAHLDAPGLDALTGDATPADAFNPDALTGDAPGVDASVVPCDPLAQTGCSVGDRCTWIVDQTAPTLGHNGCVANGTVGTGGACTLSNVDGTGFDDCVGGDACVGGVCETICDPNGGAPTCDGTHACALYDGIFANSGQPAVAGLCDPSCDPLTQTSGAAIACGSPTPTNPELGCYSGSFQQFSCSSTPVARGATAPLEDRDACTAANGCQSASGVSFSNGCAPGFVPFFFDSGTSTQVDCTGLCAPLDTDLTQATNGPGDATVLAKLPGDAAPVAGHARCTQGGRAKDANEECRYLSAFGVTGPLADTLGACLEPALFTEPLCSTLKPGTPGPTDDPNTFAVTFGCYSSTHAFAPHRAIPPARITHATHATLRIGYDHAAWRRRGGIH